MKRSLAIAIAAALGATASTAQAVMLNPRSTGQVLIYPYFTVNHQQTLVSVINTTGRGKALKIRFREGYDGRDVANFNVYLAPYDSWVGAVFDTSGDGTGAAAIATNDNSCTVPAFPPVPVPGTLHALTFGNANYSQGVYGAPTGTDSGPLGLDRTREGLFEIIEMGEVVDQANGSPKTLEAVTPFNGAPPGCAQVQGAWARNGYWNTNANTDLAPPAGGLYGAAGIVDVAQGTLYAFDATGIDGFSDVAQHTGPGDAKPNLSTAVTDSAHAVATAYVPVGNAMIRADYPASTRGVDAVSAVLMADTLYNEFDTDPALGAATDWLVAFPTKQFYVDPGIVGTAEEDVIAPFEQSFGAPANGVLQGPWACAGNNALQFDRDGHPPKYVGCGFLCPVSGGSNLCYETTVISMNAPPFSEEPSAALGSRITFPASLQVYGFESPVHGHVELEFSDGAEQMRPALDGTVFNGLPAIGFAATNYVNANVTPGVLSNYSGVYPHRSHASCTSSTTPQTACQ